ncbi:MAG TPA: helicase C-terminal domain-containing protein [Candidatus Dormibacteraeota bacterium]|nr:helicase C-terminal domain-containing protein [Candidatus Dormibacteraeota bacterium]
MPAADFVAFDLETTGLSPRSDRIIEIAGVRFGRDLRVVDRLDLIVDPGVPVPLAVQRLTGLGDAEVNGAPSGVEGAAQLAEFCEGARLVAHGAAFDLAFCAALVPGAFGGRTVLDTLELARILLPLAPSHSLPLLSAALGIEHRRPHRADSDAEATRLLFTHLVEIAEALPARLLATMRELVASIRGPLRDFLVEVVGGDGSAEVPWEVGSARSRGLRPAIDLDAVAAAPGGTLAAASVELLGPSGPLAGAEGYEYREPQLQMARAVAQTLERSGRLLVEAGTGTGKSLAYLVPLALWARRTGRRAVVATHTINLQEQLADRELPTVSRLLGTRVDHAVLKGRQHYLSLRRWERFLATPDHGGHGLGLETLRFKLKLLCWLAQTEIGDRAELRLAGSEEALWERVQSDAGDCLGGACANWRDARCFMVAARRAAADADLVITNHALLLADAERQGQVLTAYSALVVDEAHRLEEAATRQLGCELRAAAVLAVLDRLHQEDGSELDAALARGREATQRLFGDVKGFIGTALGTDHPGNATLGLTEEMRAGPGFVILERSALHARARLREAAAALRAAQGEGGLQAALLPQPERADEELELAAGSVEDAAAVVDRVLCTPVAGSVCWLELRAEQAELHEAPLQVGERLSGGVFDRVDATVLTSATLSVGGSVDFVRGRTGVGEGTETLVLPSPFDFLSQALCVLATDVPPHDDPAHSIALADLAAGVAVRLGGRTLVLFTGYAPLRSVHALLTTRMEAQGIAVLGQGLDGTRRQVLSSFVKNTRSVLLGTTSFWEGIDIPGDALSCVIIAKLPFQVPSDPLVAARGALLRDPFGELALPTAVLRLRQGFGRLIRRSADRGAVVLCDPRLDSRDYGPTFLRALPEALIVREPADGVPRMVEEFVTSGTVPEGARPRGVLEEVAHSGHDDAA